MPKLKVVLRPSRSWWIARLWRRAFIHDRGWLVFLARLRFPFTHCDDSGIRFDDPQDRVRHKRRVEIRRAFLVEAVWRAPAGEYENLCPQFWTTLAALFVYLPFVLVPKEVTAFVRAIWRSLCGLSLWLSNLWQAVPKRRKLVSAYSALAIALMLVPVQTSFWRTFSEPPQLAMHPIDRVLQDEIARNRFEFQYELRQAAVRMLHEDLEEWGAIWSATLENPDKLLRRIGDTACSTDEGWWNCPYEDRDLAREALEWANAFLTSYTEKIERAHMYTPPSRPVALVIGDGLIAVYEGARSFILWIPLEFWVALAFVCFYGGLLWWVKSGRFEKTVAWLWRHSLGPVVRAVWHGIATGIRALRAAWRQLREQVVWLAKAAWTLFYDNLCPKLEWRD